MSVPNFSFLAYLEVAKKFMCGVVRGVDHVATVSNLNPSYFNLLCVELSSVELGLGFDNKLFGAIIYYLILRKCLTLKRRSFSLVFYAPGISISLVVTKRM